MKSVSKPLLFIILDGFGICPDCSDSPINQYTAPFWYYLLHHYSHVQLYASGLYVGLPAQYPGNSQVGHLTIGTGHIVEQPITILNKMIANGSFYTNILLNNYVSQLALCNNRLHIMGIASDGTAHGHIKHIIAYIKLAKRYNVTIFLHLFLDGRDVPPTSAAHYIKQIEPYLDSSCTIATLHGRFFAMDRDENTDRTNKSLNVLLKQQDTIPVSWQEAIENSYKNNVTDEFFEPCSLVKDGIIKQNDGIISSNTRPERMIQLIKGLRSQEIKPAWIISPLSYGPTVETIALIDLPPIQTTLKAAWTDKGKTIYTISETEKWAHVTYFLDGMQDIIYSGETRVQVPSLKEKTYEHHPDMSAYVITQMVLQGLFEKKYDLFIINYANADMVAHAGNPSATAQAITCLDNQLQLLYKALKDTRGTMIITADHGNAECVLDKKSKALKRSHTSNKVPFVIISEQVFDTKEIKQLKSLSDIKKFVCNHFLCN